MVRNLFALVWLLARPRRSKELEICFCVMSWRCCAGMLAGRGWPALTGCACSATSP
jgi:hypothetical protein